MSGQVHVDRDPATEAALAVIRAEETTPARPDWVPVPDHAPTLLRDLEQMVADSRPAIGGAA
jgi:hypothetical protein